MPTPPAPGSPPLFALSIGGTEIDRAAARVRLHNWRAWVKGGVPTLEFTRHCADLDNSVDPYLTKEVTLSYDGTVYFKGDVTSLLRVKSDERRWVNSYTAEGLRRRAERFGVVDDVTGTDSSAYNVPFGEYGYVAARAGRTMGEILASVLEGTSNSASLSAAGIGAYTSAGSGASATANVASGAVSTITNLVGGTGYTTAPTVYFVGGDPTTRAIGHATVSGGAVASIVVDNAGAGYKSAPQVLISRLPAATLADIDALTIVPPHRVDVGGNQFISALESALSGVYPNHTVWVEPDGTIRFLDLRRFGGTSVAFSGTGSGALAVPVVSAAGVVTGIQLIDTGDGYTADPTVTISGDGTGATATATETGGRVTSVSLGAGGTGYGWGRTLNFVLGEHLIEPPDIHEDTAGCYARVRVTGRPIVEPCDFHLGADGMLEEDFGHDGLTSDQAKAVWKLSDFSSPTAGNGAAAATAVMQPAGIDSVFSIASGGTGGTSGSYSAAFSGGGGTGAAATYTISGGAVTAISLTAAGSGYTSAPTITFPSGGVSGASASCRLAPRGVASVTVVDGGYGYTSAPAVKFVRTDGTTGTDASATATLSGASVTSIAVGTNGTGYLTAPAVRVGGPYTPTADSGTLTCTDTTHVVVTSDDPTRTWQANNWDWTASGKHGKLCLSSAVSGLNNKVTCFVTANAALAAGGTASLTVDPPLPHLNFTGYYLYGSTQGGSRVGRLYRVTDAALAAAMTSDPWEVDVPILWSDGSSATVATANTAYIEFSNTGAAPYATSPVEIEAIDPDAGTILLSTPVQAAVDYNAAKTGGDATKWPANVHCIVGVNKGTLEAIYPADVSGVEQYAGTYHATYGKTDTLRVQIDEWKDRSNLANMQLYAQELHGSVCDVVYEGSIPFAGFLECALTPGLAINVSGDGFDTPWAGIDIPVTAADIRFFEQGVPAIATTLTVSNRRSATNAGAFLTPNIGQAGQGAAGMGGMGGFLLGAAGMAYGGSQPVMAPQSQAPLAASMGMGMGMGGGMPMMPMMSPGMTVPAGPMGRGRRRPGPMGNMASFKPGGGNFTGPLSPAQQQAAAGKSAYQVAAENAKAPKAYTPPPDASKSAYTIASENAKAPERYTPPPEASKSAYTIAAENARERPGGSSPWDRAVNPATRSSGGELASPIAPDPSHRPMTGKEIGGRARGMRDAASMPTFAQPGLLSGADPVRAKSPAQVGQDIGRSARDVGEMMSAAKPAGADVGRRAQEQRAASEAARPSGKEIGKQAKQDRANQQAIRDAEKMPKFAAGGIPSGDPAGDALENFTTFAQPGLLE